MRVSRRLVLAALLAGLAVPAQAQMSPEEMTARIEQVHGMSAEFGDAFDEITAAARDGDIETIASYGAYPFEVEANGELYDILDEETFIGNFDSLLMPWTQAAIGEQDYGSLIVTSEGIGFVDGALWMNFVCDDDSCTSGYWLITRINN